MKKLFTILAITLLASIVLSACGPSPIPTMQAIGFTPNPPTTPVITSATLAPITFQVGDIKTFKNGLMTAKISLVRGEWNIISAYNGLENNSGYIQSDGKTVTAFWWDLDNKVGVVNNFTVFPAPGWFYTPDADSHIAP